MLDECYFKPQNCANNVTQQQETNDRLWLYLGGICFQLNALYKVGCLGEKRWPMPRGWQEDRHLKTTQKGKRTSKES